LKFSQTKFSIGFGQKFSTPVKRRRRRPKYGSTPPPMHFTAAPMCVSIISNQITENQSRFNDLTGYKFHKKLL
jgi:hypothetical protein